MLPTVLDAVGLDPPAVVDGVDQQPISGASLLPTFADPDAPSPRATQYFEMIGSRAIYHDGWKATTDHVGDQLAVERDRLEGSHDFDTDHWALFHLDEDFSEAHDRAGEEPERPPGSSSDGGPRPAPTRCCPSTTASSSGSARSEPAPFGPRRRAVLRPGGGPVSEDAIPSLLGGFVLEAHLDVPASGAEGVVCALGDWNNGWACYLLDGRPVVAFSLLGTPVRLAGPEPLPAGARTLTVEYRHGPTPGGPLQIRVDDAPVADGSVPLDLPFRWQIGGAGLLVGRDRGFPVSDDYEPPFPCTAGPRFVLLEAPAAPPRDADAEVAAALRHE